MCALDISEDEGAEEVSPVWSSTSSEVELVVVHEIPPGTVRLYAVVSNRTCVNNEESSGRSIFIHCGTSDTSHIRCIRKGNRAGIWIVFSSFSGSARAAWAAVPPSENPVYQK